MRKTYFVLAVSLILVVVGGMVLPRHQGAEKPSSTQPVAAPAAIGKTETAVPVGTPTPDVAIDRQPAAVASANENSTPPAMIPPKQTPTSVKNAQGLVTREIADLGDGRGSIDRRFRYDANGKTTGETRLDPTTGQLIETVEYIRDINGTVHTRITDAAGNITAIMPDGKIIKPDSTIAN
jgi:YD repeat-containing protein